MEKFNVNKRENIPLGKYREVCAFLDCEPDAKALQSELVEPVALSYTPPEGMILIAESELESLRALANPKARFQAIPQQDSGLLKYIAELDDKTQFAMIPLERYDDLTESTEKLVQVKSGQVLKMEDFINNVFNDPKNDYVIVKRDVVTTIRTLFNGLF